MRRALSGLLVLALLPTARASEVAKLCQPAGWPVVELEAGDRAQNLDLIRSKIARSGSELALLYTEKSLSLKAHELAAEADRLNSRALPKSDAKELFLRYSTELSRKSDPDGFARALIETYFESVPAPLNKLPWFARLSDSAIASSSIGPGDLDEHSYFGAKMRLSRLENRRYSLEVLYSFGETMPYLLTLLSHELEHAHVYKERIDLYDKEKELAEFNLVDEAQATDFQLKTYLALVKRDPKLYCNWVYVSGLYDGLPVPLSWKMASTERSLRDGTLLKEYAARSPLASALLDKGQIRPDLRKRISGLKLQFID